MSTDSSSPDANPSKKTPAPGKLSKDSTEIDLWDLDEDDISAPTPEKTRNTAIPSHRPGESSVQSKKPIEKHIEVPLIAKKNPPKPEPKPENIIKRETASNKPSPKPHTQLDISESKSKVPSTTTPVAEPASEEISGIPVSSEETKIKPNSSLSKIEKIGILSLIAILILGATFTIIHFADNVPTRPVISRDLEFPIKGQLVSITSASTYWREPIITGENADIVKRDTKLIPVLKISFEAKPGAIRIFFRNENGEVVGDAITRAVGGKTQLSIPATAGFDDIGMHAAYRTGESIPWIVQIFEAPTGNASREQFKKIFESEISTDIR
ncbi:MAG: hypothetical protein H7Y36_05440 [Armatimonadetes bacterium]|nr:hypothetical protein [Akkermansiaceae bacterium]